MSLEEKKEYLKYEIGNQKFNDAEIIFKSFNKDLSDKPITETDIKKLLNDKDEDEVSKLLIQLAVFIYFKNKLVTEESVIDNELFKNSIEFMNKNISADSEVSADIEVENVAAQVKKYLIGKIDDRADKIISYPFIYANEHVYHIIEQLYNVRLMIFVKDGTKLEYFPDTRHIYTRNPSKYILLFNSKSDKHFSLIKQGSKVSFKLDKLLEYQFFKDNFKNITYKDIITTVNSAGGGVYGVIPHNDDKNKINKLTVLVECVGVLLDELIEYYDKKRANDSSQVGLLKPKEIKMEAIKIKEEVSKLSNKETPLTENQTEKLNNLLEETRENLKTNSDEYKQLNKQITTYNKINGLNLIDQILRIVASLVR